MGDFGYVHDCDGLDGLASGSVVPIQCRPIQVRLTLRVGTYSCIRLQHSPSKATIMARLIVVMVVVVFLRLATNNRPERVVIAVLVELFARHELA